VLEGDVLLEEPELESCGAVVVEGEVLLGDALLESVLLACGAIGLGVTATGLVGSTSVVLLQPAAVKTRGTTSARKILFIE